MVEPVTATETVYDDGGMRERIEHVPLGVVGNISAWNYPWFVGCNVIVPALLTGNAVLYKPSEYATLTGLEIARLLHEAGVPPDVFQPLVGAGAVGAALLEQKRRRPVLHRLVRHRRAHRADHRPALRQAAAGARRQGPDLCLRRRRPEGRRRVAGRRRDVQHRPELLLGRAHLRAREDPRRLPRRLRRDREGLQDRATRWTRPPTSARSRARRSSTCWTAQVADAQAKGAKLLHRRPAPARPRQLVRAHGVQRRRPPHGADARRKLRPDHRHPEGGRRRGSDRADERHALRPHGRRLHAATRRAPSSSCRASTPAACTGTAATASARACPGAASATRASALTLSTLRHPGLHAAARPGTCAAA